jgi:glycosyltransferase involved in cell wall biosynthesis
MLQPMQVLYVTRPILPPWNEGSIKLVWQLASRLQRHNAHLLTTSNSTLPKTDRAIVWHPVYSASKLTNWQKVRLALYLLKNHPEIELYHFYFVPTLLTSRFLSALCRIHKKPTVQTVPSLPALDLSASQTRQLFFADCTITYSEATTTFLRERGVNSVVQINAGTPPVAAVQKEEICHFRQQLGLPEDAVLVLYSGEYTRLGSIDRLQVIMPEVLARCPNCHFVLACRKLLPTDPTIEANLQQTVAQWGLTNRIHFVGEVDDFPMLLQSSDIFLFPVTDMTGKIDTPLTILEAMAARLPVVMQAVSPLDEIFSHESLALAPDEDALVERLLSLAASSSLRQREGSRGLEITHRQYDLNKMVTAYEEFYDSLS